MTIATVLVGVDFSPPSDAALEEAIALALRHQSRLVLVHGCGVSDAGFYMHQVAGRVEETWKTFVRERLEHAQAELDSRSQRCRDAGVESEARVVAGFGDEAIVALKGEVTADLVVVGTHGRTGLDRLLVGSVAEHVVRMAERHVLVVRSKASGGADDKSAAGDARRGRLAAPRRLLVGTDFSPASEPALGLAFTLATEGTRIEVLHAWQPPSQLGPAPEWLRLEMIERAQRLGQELIAGPKAQGMDIGFRLVEAPSANALAQRATRGRFDAVVVGTHGRRGVRRLLLGSVAEQVVRIAPCSVFVAHQLPDEASRAS
jgi:nucleotide-binding universal stress UspA family protein